MGEEKNQQNVAVENNIADLSVNDKSIELKEESKNEVLIEEKTPEENQDINNEIESQKESEDIQEIPVNEELAFDESSFIDHNNIGNIDLLLSKFETLSNDFEILAEKIESLNNQPHPQEITSQSISNIINDQINEIQNKTNKKMRIFLYHVLVTLIICLLLFFFSPKSSYYQKVRSEKIKNDLMDPLLNEKIETLEKQLASKNDTELNTLKETLKKEIIEELSSKK